jgi:hypothetical protein
MQIAMWVSNISFCLALGSLMALFWYGIKFVTMPKFTKQAFNDVALCALSTSVFSVVTGVATMPESPAIGVGAMIFAVLPFSLVVSRWRHRKCVTGESCSVRQRKKAKAAKKNEESQ